ncbi:iron complex outermembrane receptor protein [Paucibacter oligotrophus]|uniref:Iron complex outermembrane receptor protein n=1 Tax=Roseateles oligotrophus TaxID=1769250 RepID=A0A840LC03_9BURK|nr:TonB-dependent receptor [Roseateles oligotrophus]MBB4845686.1 iron complex outermembrane receptor protein [Roseateles oligotrophus]
MRTQEKKRLALACAQACLALATLPFHGQARACDDCDDTVHAKPTNSAGPVHKLGLVLISGSAPSSLPNNIPTTLESISAAEIAKSINATDAEDALKYLPSLLVRKRYIGDYNHAVLSTRASGTGNSARSLVFADGIPISNLLGNGASFTPRWGLVTPEEIERVDVLYGPFSAAYSGNSVGAVVDYQTRSPKAFEAHAKAGVFVQPFELYGSNKTYGGHHTSASLGDRAGALSWWINLNHLDSEGQPQTFVVKPLSGSNAAASATPLSGAVAGMDKNNQPWLILGAGTQYRTQQDHAKLKLAYDINPVLRASYTLGWWGNSAVGRSESYLRDASGQAFYAAPAHSGTAKASPIAIDGRAYTLGANDFGQSRDELRHQMQGLSIKSHSKGLFDFELAASRYAYERDESRSALLARPASEAGGAGRLSDLAGTGWTTLAAKAQLRPSASHVIELGLQQERYQWQQRVSDVADWINGAPTALFTAFSGKTQLNSAYAQEAWTISPELKAVIGLRLEDWRALDGSKTSAAGKTVNFERRSEQYVSPKAALGYALSEDWSLKLSTGRAVRMPTAGELFQGGVNAAGVYVESDPTTNPNLKPERGWTSELSALWASGTQQQLRATLFLEDTRDALYSQTTVVDGKNISSTQNIGRIRTLGLELSYQAADLFLQGLELQGSLTYADSKILANEGFVAKPGDTLGMQQPRVPKWRASGLIGYAITPELSASYGLRYSGPQYGTLNNSDPNGSTYQGFSKFFTTDVRLQWRVNKQWTLAGGIDNLNNYQYWNFHPYPQRTYHAELKFDL